MARLADRIAERNRARVEALAFDIADRGFVAAEEYARSAFEASDGPLAEFRKAYAITLVEHRLGDPAIESLRLTQFYDCTVQMPLPLVIASLQRSGGLQPALCWPRPRRRGRADRQQRALGRDLSSRR